MAEQFLSGQASLNLIKGWTLEYYQITKSCYQAILPAISSLFGFNKEQAVDFCLEEYGHDQMIFESLLALGFDEHTINNAQPLPETLSYINLLASWARNDPLSFMAALFIYEGTTTDGISYIQALMRYDVPATFIQKHKAHNDINLNGDHGSISRDFFSKIPAVSVEQNQRVRSNIALLFETDRAMQAALFEFYSDRALPLMQDDFNNIDDHQLLSAESELFSFEPLTATLNSEKINFFFQDITYAGSNFFSRYLDKMSDCFFYNKLRRCLVKHLRLCKTQKIFSKGYHYDDMRWVDNFLMVSAESDYISCLWVYLKVHRDILLAVIRQHSESCRKAEWSNKQNLTIEQYKQYAAYLTEILVLISTLPLNKKSIQWHYYYFNRLIWEALANE